MEISVYVLLLKSVILAAWKTSGGRKASRLEPEVTLRKLPQEWQHFFKTDKNYFLTKSCKIFFLPVFQNKKVNISKNLWYCHTFVIDLPRSFGEIFFKTFNGVFAQWAFFAKSHPQLNAEWLTYELLKFACVILKKHLKRTPHWKKETKYFAELLFF